MTTSIAQQRVDKLTNARLAYANCGRNWAMLAPQHREAFHVEARRRGLNTALERFCLINQCEPRELYAIVLMRLQRDDGCLYWNKTTLCVQILNGARLPWKFTVGELVTLERRNIYLPRTVYSEAIRFLSRHKLTPRTMNE